MSPYFYLTWIPTSEKERDKKKRRQEGQKGKAQLKAGHSTRTH
jgi:hypothetical protein